MAEEELKKAILEKIQKEKETLLGEAREVEANILKEAKEGLSSLEKEFLRGVEKNCLLTKAKRLNEISRETEARIQEAKEKKISLVLSRVKETLKSIQKDRNLNRPVFKFLLEEALPQLSHIQTPLKLKVNPSDTELAQAVLKELKLDVKLETKETINGGLEVCDLEERIIVLNTFESRLEKLTPELCQEISRILFNHLTI